MCYVDYEFDGNSTTYYIFAELMLNISVLVLTGNSFRKIIVSNPRGLNFPLAFSQHLRKSSRHRQSTYYETMKKCNYIHNHTTNSINKQSIPFDKNDPTKL